MKPIKLLATNWGFEGSLDAFGAKAKKEGYDGIETWWPMETNAQNELFSMLDRYGLEAGFLCGSIETDYKTHYYTFCKMVDAAASCSAIRPLYINCHSGRDFFTFEENTSFIDHTISVAERTGIKICHETHRSRLLYAAPVAKHYFSASPKLRITFDLSHWCNVSESFLEDQLATVDKAIERADHIHARVGHPEGPQVSDPRAPEWRTAVDIHFAWWDRIVKIKKDSGDTLTVLTEFGPPDYMPTTPYVREPLSDQWEINVYMMRMFRERYGA